MRLFRVSALLLATALAAVVPTGSAVAAKASWSFCGPSRLMLEEPAALVTAVGTGCKAALDVEFWYDAPVRASSTAPHGYRCPDRPQKWGVTCTKGATKVVISWLYAYGRGNDCANGQVATGQGIEEVLGLTCAQGKKVIQQLVDGTKPSFGLRCKVTREGDASCATKTGKRALIGSAYTA